VGVMTSKDFDKKIFTLELPDLDNANNISCIPAGLYECQKTVSPSLGSCINVSNVVGRTYIRIHSGNYTSQIEGCILVGDSLKDFNNDGVIDVTNSADTLIWLLDWVAFNSKPIFTLKII
jgi:hypothetical protein